MNNDNSYRVLRGGCWNDAARYARVARRYWYFPSFRDGFLGFRLSRIVSPLEQLSEVILEQ